MHRTDQTSGKQQATWIFTPRMVSSVRPKRRMFTSRSSAPACSWGRWKILLAVFSVGQLCDELGNSYSWQPEENPKITECERTITCCSDNFVPLVAVTKQKSCSVLGYNFQPSTTPEGRTLCQERRRRRSELFSELMIDVDDDALVEKSFSWKRSKG